MLTVNGISEERVSEFRELASEFNQQMHGRPLFRAEREEARYSPGRFSPTDPRQIAKSFRDRIEKEFGKQVLNDILSLNGYTFFMDQIDRRHPIGMILFQDPKQKERLKNLYDVELDGDAGEFVKYLEETDRLHNREKDFWVEWRKHYGSPWIVSETFLFLVERYSVDLLEQTNDPEGKGYISV